MQLDNEQQQREICYYILAYLADNPEAGDTFDGIVEWWLLNQRIKFETRNVSEAVARLVTNGLILEQKKSDSQIIYRVDKTREQTIRRMLSEIKMKRH